MRLCPVEHSVVLKRHSKTMDFPDGSAGSDGGCGSGGGGGTYCSSIQKGHLQLKRQTTNAEI